MPNAHSQKAHRASPVSAPAIKAAPVNAGNNNFISDAATLDKLVDGGAGFDTLTLTSSLFDSEAANLRSIERIVFNGSGTLWISPENLVANGSTVVAVSSTAAFDPMRSVALGDALGFTPWHDGHVTSADLQGDARFSAILAADKAAGLADDYVAYSVPAVNACHGGHAEIILLVNTAVPASIA